MPAGFVVSPVVEGPVVVLVVVEELVVVVQSAEEPVFVVGRVVFVVLLDRLCLLRNRW